MMSEATFTRKFLEITVAADSSIRETHRIMCYQDGDLNNNANHNVFILHISDVLNIHMRKKMGLDTTLLIKTHSLSFIPETTRNKFIEEILTCDMLMFLEENVDFFTGYTAITQTTVLYLSELQWIKNVKSSSYHDSL
jgi:hypothetical protein